VLGYLSYSQFKDVTYGVFEKLEKGEKIPRLELGNLKPAPSDLCSNAYRNLPGS